MSKMPETVEDWRSTLNKIIQRLNAITSEQFFDGRTLNYDANCLALEFIGLAFDRDMEDWKRFMETTPPARGKWLPLDPAALDRMDATEILYRLNENIGDERFIDGALVEAFESGSLVKALGRLVGSLDTFKLRSDVGSAPTPPARP
jgi:hypothetical protein